MHGSKKWIQDYRGRWKRSSDRTKKDYYAGLRKWKVPYRLRYGQENPDTGEFCPQCKHVQKSLHNDYVTYYAVRNQVRQEWKTLFGDSYWVKVDGKSLYFEDYFHQHKDYPGPLWNYDLRSYLCFKHERMYEQEREMWYANYHGKKRGSQWTIKHERQKYRRQVKQKMARAKYDEEVYDEILPPRRGWLD